MPDGLPLTHFTADANRQVDRSFSNPESHNMDRRALTAVARDDWESHGCGDTEPGPGNLRKQRLTEVRHVAHINEAQRILADGRVKAALVRDSTGLPRSWRPVSWLSANQWGALGSIYGHVEFTFDWQTIIANRRLYWVETIRHHRLPAYRILVTDQQAPRRLVRYRPRKHHGPLVREADTWYWNGDSRVSEFLVQDDLPLKHCKAINFIEHRHDHCKDYGRQCPDAALNPMLAKFLTIAFALASSAHAADTILRREDGWLSPVDQFVDEFVHHLSLEARFRRPSSGLRGARSLMCAILALWSHRDYSSASALAKRFSKKAFRKTLMAVVGEHFDETRYRPKRGRDFTRMTGGTTDD